ncbi:hypothetical protein E4K10_46740 [Streptomyces sp. T1317-0309]|nr:hypothetical protein E4K10_46740 [Streptomyces sp. T1317-0309]
MADGKRLLGLAGALLPRRCEDRTILTDLLVRILPSSTAASWRDPTRPWKTGHPSTSHDLGQPPSISWELNVLGPSVHQPAGNRRTPSWPSPDERTTNPAT